MAEPHVTHILVPQFLDPVQLRPIALRFQVGLQESQPGPIVAANRLARRIVKKFRKDKDDAYKDNDRDEDEGG